MQLFLIYDLGSALYNHIIGEHSRAKQNWKDVGIDAASMIIPGVAAPMMKGVGKVANKLDNAADAGKVMKNADAITSQKHINIYIITYNIVNCNCFIKKNQKLFIFFSVAFIF